MKTHPLLLLSILMILLSLLETNAQTNSTYTQKTKVKTIWDIPHKTLWQKWMWVHRSITYKVLKEKPINYDTAYVKSYAKSYVVTLPLNTRFLQFSLIDAKSHNKLTFAPSPVYNLGISISTKWASFIIQSGIKVYKSNTAEKGETKFKNYQLNLYGRKITTNTFFQYYNGYYIKNSQSFDNYKSDKPYSIRSDVYCLNIGVSTYYIVNHKRFSYKNSFAFTEQQKKSAGSVLVGTYYSYFEVNSDSAFVKSPFINSFDSLSIIQNGHTHNFGFNLGYIYTLVFFKKCFVTASVAQGVGAVRVVYKREDNSTYKRLVGGAGKLNLLLAFGYDQGKYFVGGIALFDYFLFRGLPNSTFDYSFGNFMIYTGYRFSFLKKERKLLHRMKLIDY
jgi:Domain of unknown function (DUF4421)